jgi:hypothetical protein
VEATAARTPVAEVRGAWVAQVAQKK